MTQHQHTYRSGIPPDHVVHRDRVFPADTVPEVWSIPKEIFQPIWERGVTGRGVRISIHDTGVARHDQLPAPVFARDLTRSRAGNALDENGHGTHCTGTALGRDGVGVAPEADLIVIKVLDNNGFGSTTDINEARRIAASEGADIISESLGSGDGMAQDVDSIREAIDAGVQVDVAAAGNSGFRGRNTIGYPARYPQTLCIGAYRRDGQISTFSSGGREIDLATPGEQIVSCSHRGGFVAMSGTSMATPHFAGLMALVIHRRRMLGMPDLHGADAWRAFFDVQGFFSDGGEPGRDERFGLGRPLVANILAWLVEPEWV